MESIFNAGLMLGAIVSGYVVIGVIVAGLSLGLARYFDNVNEDHSLALSIIFWPVVLIVAAWDFLLVPLSNTIGSIFEGATSIIGTGTERLLRGVTGKGKKVPSGERQLPATFQDRVKEEVKE